MSDMNTGSEPIINKASAEGEMALRADMLKAKPKSESSVETEAKTSGENPPQPEIEGEIGSKSAVEKDGATPQLDASEGDHTEKAAKGQNTSKPAASGSATGTVSTFMSTLQEAESSRDPEAIASLFEEGAELWRQNFSKGQQSDGATVFWKQYLDNFKDVKSEFTKVQEQSGLAVLEWESEGHLKNGEGFHYAGVSILNYEAEGKISSFKTYYDSSALSMKSRDQTH